MKERSFAWVPANKLLEIAPRCFVGQEITGCVELRFNKVTKPGEVESFIGYDVKPERVGPVPAKLSAPNLQDPDVQSILVDFSKVFSSQPGSFRPQDYFASFLASNILVREILQEKFLHDGQISCHLNILADAGIIKLPDRRLPLRWVLAVQRRSVTQRFGEARTALTAVGVFGSLPDQDLRYADGLDIPAGLEPEAVLGLVGEHLLRIKAQRNHLECSR